MDRWMRSLLTLQPITATPQLISLYIQYTLVSLLLAAPWWGLLWLIEIPPAKREKITIRDLLWVVPVENLLFRAIPLWFGGTSWAVFGHVLWALLHGPYAFTFVVLHGLLELRLWLGGMWFEAVLIHFLHDLFLVLLIKIGREFG